MTSVKEQDVYLRRQVELAERRLGTINVQLTQRGFDPRLSAEADALTMQLAALRVELREAQAA